MAAAPALLTRADLLICSQDAVNTIGSKRSRPRICLILPAFNEAKRIEQTIASIARYQQASGAIGAVVIADDGSTDGTAGIVAQAAEQVGLEIDVLRMPHRGKAWTVRSAMLSVVAVSDCDYFMQLDADDEIGVEQLDRVPWSDDPFALYVGRRVGQVGGDHGVTASRLRRGMSTAMRFASRVLLGLTLPDTQCGFKLFPRPIVAELFSQQRSHGWEFDAEILYIAQQVSRLQILEVPVVWRPRGTSKVRPWAAVGSAIGMMAIAGRRTMGAYRPVWVGPASATAQPANLLRSEVG